MLVEKAAQGDEVAVGDLLERLRPRIVLWCANRMSPKLKAKVVPEDAAQEVLIAVHKALPAFDPEGGRSAFLAWVFKIAGNRIRDLVDHHGALKRRTVPPQSFSQTTPSRAVARADLILHMREAMQDLPEDYRRVIHLRRLEEREIEDVAAVMGRSKGATHTLYWRAVEALRKAMKQRGCLSTDVTL